MQHNEVTVQLLLIHWAGSEALTPCCTNMISPFSIGDIFSKEPDIFDIRNWLAEYKHKWMSIGEGLRVGDGDLQSIRRDTGLDDGDRLAAMLRKWRDSKCSPFTWQNIIDVLETPAIDLKRAADNIRSKLSVGG